MVREASRRDRSAGEIGYAIAHSGVMEPDMRRLAFATMMCALTLGASAQTLPQPNVPAISAQPQRYGGEGQPAQKPQPASPSAVTVNVQPTPEGEGGVQQNESQRDEKAGLDRRMVELTADLAAYSKWLAYATIALTGATIGLFAFAVLQFRDAKEVGRAARESADAAKLSAASVIAAEGAKVVVTKVSLEGQGHRSNEDRLRNPVVDAHAKNYGRSPAFLRSTCVKVFCGDRLPAVPDYGDGRTVVDVILEDREGHDLEPGYPTGGPLSDEDAEGVLAGTKRLWAFGYVRFGDVFNSSHTVRFCGSFVVSKTTGELAWAAGGPAAYAQSS